MKFNNSNRGRKLYAVYRELISNSRKLYVLLLYIFKTLVICQNLIVIIIYIKNGSKFAKVVRAFKAK